MSTVRNFERSIVNNGRYYQGKRITIIWTGLEREGFLNIGAAQVELKFFGYGFDL